MMTTEVNDAAVAVARRVGYRNVTRKLLADELAPLPRFGGNPQVAHNWLVNTGRMHDVIGYLMTNKDRLALVPGVRQPSANANYWKPYDKAELLRCAYRIATDEGLFKLTINKVVKASGFATGTLRNYFGDLESLRDEVVREAIRNENLRVIAQGLVRDRPATDDIPQYLRQAASKSLA